MTPPVIVDARQAAAFDYAALTAGMPANGAFAAWLAQAYFDAHRPVIEVIEPETPDLPAETIAKRGDIWLLGKHRLMCGDSSNVDHIHLLVEDRMVGMVYTDPPYGTRLDTDYSRLNERKLRYASSLKTVLSKKWNNVIGDDQYYDPTLILKTFASVPEIFLWGADYYCRSIPPDGSWVVWDKRSTADGSPIGKFHGAHFELCWSKSRHQRQIFRMLWMGLYGRQADGPSVHPTQKPVAMAQWFLDLWGKGTRVVADLYGGSGSTLLACERADKQCLMMEIDEAYCDVIIARWEKMTGKVAERIAG